MTARRLFSQDSRRGAQRVWRARKHHTWIDAQIRPAADATGFELQFFYDGSLVLTRVWPTRESALGYADRQLRELQRSGWNTHW
jgi:hypothetical protein